MAQIHNMIAYRRKQIPATQIPRSRCTRTKLLNSLGMFRDEPPKQQRNAVSKSGGQLISSRSAHMSVSPKAGTIGATALQERLKHSEINHYFRNKTRTPQRSGSSVTFEEIVSVVEIPSRHQYSNRVKKHLWSGRDEISEMANRNIIEFEFEDFDWRNVVLDDEMYIDSLNGRLVHPCHIPNGGTCFDDTKEEGEFKPLSRQCSFAG